MVDAVDAEEPELLRLVEYRSPVLHTPSDIVGFPLSHADRFLIASMLWSVQEEQLERASAPWPSAAGMAAPQWGHPRRIFLMRQAYLETTSDGPLAPEGVFAVVINPEYEGISSSSDQIVHECEDWVSAASPIA